MNSSHDYSDIIGLPHPEPRHHTRMPIEARAAQFMPFAALTGYEACIAEQGRDTQQQRELGQDRKAELDAQLARLIANLHHCPVVIVTHFVPDERKAGGHYATATAPALKIDESNLALVLEGVAPIPIANITALDGDIFD